MSDTGIDALIARLRREAAANRGVWGEQRRYLCDEAADALAAQQEKLAQMAEIEGRADEVCKINDELTAQIAALKADAERYRHLRLSSEFKIDRRHSLEFDGSLWRL